MNPEKDERKKLDRFKSLFFQIGLIFTLLIVLFAFEWKSCVSCAKDAELESGKTEWGPVRV